MMNSKKDYLIPFTNMTRKQVIDIISNNPDYFLDNLMTIEEYNSTSPNYEKAYNLLMEYWDSIADEEKEELDKRLKECGL